MANQVVLTLSDVGLTKSGLTERRVVLTEEVPVLPVGRASKVSAKGLTAEADNGWYDSPVMSRKHAEIVANFEDLTVAIQDIKSLHGTYHRPANANQDSQLQAGQPQLLATGDQVRFGIDIFRGDGSFPPCVVDVKIDWETTSRPVQEHAQKATNTFRVPNDDDSDIVDDGEAGSSLRDPVDLTMDVQSTLPSALMSDVIDLTSEVEAMKQSRPCATHHDSVYESDSGSSDINWENRDADEDELESISEVDIEPDEHASTDQFSDDEDDEAVDDDENPLIERFGEPLSDSEMSDDDDCVEGCPFHDGPAQSIGGPDFDETPLFDGAVVDCHKDDSELLSDGRAPCLIVNGLGPILPVLESQLTGREPSPSDAALFRGTTSRPNVPVVQDLGQITGTTQPELIPVIIQTPFAPSSVEQASTQTTQSTVPAAQITNNKVISDDPLDDIEHSHEPSAWAGSGSSFLNSPLPASASHNVGRTRLQSPSESDVDMTSAYTFHQSRVSVDSTQGTNQEVRRLPVKDLLVTSAPAGHQPSGQKRCFEDFADDQVPVAERQKRPTSPKFSPASSISRRIAGMRYKRASGTSSHEKHPHFPAPSHIDFPVEPDYSPCTPPHYTSADIPVAGSIYAPVSPIFSAATSASQRSAVPRPTVMLDETSLAAPANSSVVEGSSTTTRPAKRRRLLEVAACAIIGGAAVFSALVGTAPQLV